MSNESHSPLPMQGEFINVPDISFMAHSYIERPALIQQIKDKLLQSNSAILVPSVNLVGCYGLGGIGKTFLALGYYYSSSYPKKIWVNAENLTEIHQSFQFIAEELSIPYLPTDSTRVIRQKIKIWLKKNPGWLMVFDNAENYAAIQEYLPQSGGDIVITSRSPHWSNTICVDVMQEDEAIALVRVITQRQEGEKSEIQALIKMLGYLPLAIAQASAYIKMSNISIENYINLYHREATRLLNDRSLEVEPGHKHDPVAITWTISLKAIDVNNPQAINLLNICAFLSPDTIDYKLLQETLDIPDAYDFNKHIQSLLSYSMIKKGEKTETFSLHRLVQKITLNNINVRDKVYYLNLLAKFYQSNFTYQRDNLDKIKKLQCYLPHVITFVEHAVKAGLKDTCVIKLLHTVGSYHLDYLNDSDEAEKWLERSINEAQRQQSHFMGNDTYLLLIRVKINKKQYANAISLLEDIHPYNDEEQIKIQFYYFDLYKRDKQYQKALNCLSIVEKDLKTLEDKALESRLHHYYGQLYLILAKEQSSNDFDDLLIQKAGSHYLCSLKLKKQLYGSNHFEVARTYLQLGNVYFEIAEYDKARQYYNNALNINLDFYKTEFKGCIGNAYYALAEINFKFKKWQLSYEHICKCLRIREKLDGKESYPYQKAKDLYESIPNAYRNPLSTSSQKNTKLVRKVNDHLDVEQPKNKKQKIGNTAIESMQSLEMPTTCVQQIPSQVINNTNQKLNEPIPLVKRSLFAPQTTTKIGSSIPYALANHEDYKAVIKQKIQDGPGANPEYKLLLEKLIDPRYKEEKEFIKEQMNIIIQSNRNKEANHFLRWLEDNYEKVKGARQTVEFENNAIDLFIRENPEKYSALGENNAKPNTPANLKGSP